MTRIYNYVVVKLYNKKWVPKYILYKYYGTYIHDTST